MADDVSFRTEGAAPAKAATPDFGAWLGGQDRALQTWVEFSNGLMKNALEISQEIMTFSQSRLQAEMGAWQALASCRNPTEFFEHQRQFAEQRTTQYFDEASKLATRIMELVRGAQEQALKQKPA
jgi:hypothetical protein